MKSDKKKWSDKNMDEILTSFFQAEVPSRLERPLRLATPAVRSHVPASAVVGAQAPSRWMKVALAEGLYASRPVNAIPSLCRIERYFTFPLFQHSSMLKPRSRTGDYLRKLHALCAW